MKLQKSLSLSIAVLLIVGFMLLARLSRMTRAAEHAA